MVKPDILKFYTVQDQKTKDPFKIAYVLNGPKGAVYALIRNQEKPELMFAVNGHGKVCKVRGVEWFTDKNGKLEVWA